MTKKLGFLDQVKEGHMVYIKNKLVIEYVVVVFVKNIHHHKHFPFGCGVVFLHTVQ